MTRWKRQRFVIAIYPNSRGVAFVVFESARSLIDWGIKTPDQARSNERHLAAITALLELYDPAIVVLQDMSPGGTRRAPRIRALNEMILELANDWDIPVHSYSRAEVLDTFAKHGIRTKAEIAAAIGERVPALRRFVPPPRKPWMSEHAWMGLFDAAALALTFQGIDAPDARSPVKRESGKADALPGQS